MATSESHELRDARRSLELFAEQPSTPAGMRALGDAAAALIDVLETPATAREARVAQNLLDSYSSKIAHRAMEQLSNIQAVPDEEIEEWYTVMTQLRELDSFLSSEFGRVRTELVGKLLDRWLDQVPKLQRRKFLEDLQARFEGAG